jgi:hypothetical protein
MYNARRWKSAAEINRQFGIIKKHYGTRLARKIVNCLGYGAPINRVIKMTPAAEPPFQPRDVNSDLIGGFHKIDETSANSSEWLTLRASRYDGGHNAVALSPPANFINYRCQCTALSGRKSFKRIVHKDK